MITFLLFAISWVSGAQPVGPLSCEPQVEPPRRQVLVVRPTDEAMSPIAATGVVDIRVVERGDVASFIFAENFYDEIYFLQATPVPSWLDQLRTFQRCLKPGGTLYFSHTLDGQHNLTTTQTLLLDASFSILDIDQTFNAQGPNTVTATVSKNSQ